MPALAARQVALVTPDASHVVVLGGTGRVGSSTAAWLAKQPGLRLTLCGRSRERYNRLMAERPELRDSTSFAPVDLDGNRAALVQALRGADAVLHCAGPFQGRADSDVLLASLEAGVPAYVDACDDAEYARRSRALSERAMEAKMRAVVCGGIFPGVSNLMASELVRTGVAEERGAPSSVSYSYYTAGSGGAGPTILATSLLLCGEDAVVFRDGARLALPPVSGRRVVDFGTKAGKREVFLYNLPEVESTHQHLAVPSVSARFGTSPGVWNGAMGAMATLLPRSTLRDPAAALSLARLLDPLVRLVDVAVGERTAMRVDVRFAGGSVVSSRYVARSLRTAVGACLGAFVLDLLQRSGPALAGVRYPEEEGALQDAPLLLSRAAEGAEECALGKASWQLDSKSTHLGFGMYLD